MGSMRQTFRSFAAVVLFALLACSAYAEKKLIEFGWDEPDTRFMREHITEMEQTPFDGCVFTVLAKNSDGTNVRFFNECWGRREFKKSELQGALADLEATRFRKFTDCFMRLDVTPGDVDWFDDFSSITNNVELAARVVREGRVKGILFDVEPYAAQLFDYTKLRDAKTKSFEAYAKQTRVRGREVMEAFQKGYPNLKVFLTFGFEISQLQMEAAKKPLAEVQYGLLPALLNGMIDGARGKSLIIDGFEPSYGYRNKIDYDEAIRIRKRSMALVADPKRYGEYYRYGFGLWMDMDWRKHGWDTKDISKNYFTPQSFENSVRMALSASDEYVWIYTEKPSWWSAKGKQNLPPEYETALRRARGN
jgi:hypothetical protein